MSARIAEMQRAMARVCFDRTPSERDLEALGMERARLYRDMVRSRLRELVSVALPWTERTIGRAETSALFASFLEDAPPRSRYFREVVPAFVAFVLPRLQGSMYPAHAGDVAALEGARWELGWRSGEVTGPIEDLSLEKVPVPHPTLRVLSLGHAVHRADASAAIDAPPAGEFFVSVHRRPDHRVETRTLDATGARLVRAWARADRPAIDAVRMVLAEEAREADAAFVESMGALLAALSESGALLGSRP
jgi:hypothetical protein